MGNVAWFELPGGAVIEMYSEGLETELYEACVMMVERPETECTVRAVEAVRGRGVIWAEDLERGETPQEEVEVVFRLGWIATEI